MNKYKDLKPNKIYKITEHVFAFLSPESCFGRKYSKGDYFLFLEIIFDKPYHHGCCHIKVLGKHGIGYLYKREDDLNDLMVQI